MRGPATAPELPEAVLRRLATCARVALRVGDPPSETTATVTPAPLQGALYALLPEGAPLLARVRAVGTAELRADEGDWNLTVRCRAVHGRRLTADARRSELLHWLPEGAVAAGWATVRLLPEELVVGEGEGARRQRAAGPVRGHVPRTVGERWGRLLGWRTPLAAAMPVALQIVLAFAFFEEGWARATGMLLTVTGTGVCIAGALGWDAVARLRRWREGLMRDDDAGPMLEGLLPEEPTGFACAAAGVGGLLLVLAAAATLGVVSGVPASGLSAAWGFGASGAWIAWPAVLLRQALRRADAGVDTRDA